MALPDPAYWSDLVRGTLGCYDEELLRRVAARLVRTRNQWPVDDLVDRIVATLDNPAGIDRRLQELEPAGRRLLALVGHSRQPCWYFGNLVEMLLALGHADGLQPVFALLEAGLVYPLLAGCAGAQARGSAKSAAVGRIKSFEQWLGFAGTTGLMVFSPPQVAARAVGEELGLPDLSGVRGQGSGVREEEETGAGGEGPPQDGVRSSPTPDPWPLTPVHEADGLEWLLRLGVLWQRVAAAPLRRTLQGGFFKRDHERIAQDPLLNGPPADHLADVPDAGFLAMALAERAGVVREIEGELRAGELPAAWAAGLAAGLGSLWAELPRLRSWNPLDGWRGGEDLVGNPFPSACLLALLLLARLPEGAWVRPDVVQAWLLEHHPYWAAEAVRPSRQRPWLETFLLGVAYHLRAVQAARDADGAWRVRLAPTGRWLLGLGDVPAAEAPYPQTLLVQPNLEVLAYRQGLTPALVGKLTRFAAWKSLGAACILQLEPATVYRALESGQTFESIRLTLEQHGTRAVPAAVLDSLRTWSDKRDRITVYPSATLLEFAGADDLNEALARGLPGVRIADNLAVVAREEDIDFRHFRLSGTRDYALPPEKCVTVEADGVTLTVDPARSDLLLETELPRFAERVGVADGRRQYRLTPASLGAAREGGLGAAALEAWFRQRAGQPLPPAARLLLVGGQAEAPRLQRHLVLHVADEELADGLMQWPQTRPLIAARLGPTALAVEEEQAGVLRERLQAAGITVAES